MVSSSLKVISRWQRAFEAVKQGKVWQKGKEMTSHERITLALNHKEPDRIPIFDGFWGTTIERWKGEGWPQSKPTADYFEFDKMFGPAVIEEEIKTKVTVAKKNGGYIYHSDHSVPDNVSFQQYQRVIELVRKYGAY
jgi:hypothetical protein